MRAILDPDALRGLMPDVDVEMVALYLDCFRKICTGDATAGEIALLSRPERFHWLSSPRSDLLQASPVHEGIGEDLEAVLEGLFTSMVG
jgi:hypothetical protein